MRQGLSTPAIVAIIAVVVIVIGFIGWHFMSGGPNANVNNSMLNYYKHGAGNGAKAANAPPSAASNAAPKGQ